MLEIMNTIGRKLKNEKYQIVFIYHEPGHFGKSLGNWFSKYKTKTMITSTKQNDKRTGINAFWS